MGRPRLLNLIGGKNVAPANKSFLENISPATSTFINEFPDSSSNDIHNAVEVASRAFQNTWKHTTITDRIELCHEIAFRLQGRASELAAAESLDTGKPLKLAMNMDIARAIDNFKFFAAQGVAEGRSSFASDEGFNISTKSPLGVVGLITPWNLPLYLLTWKVAPALIMGNCIVAKPSELTPTTASILGEVCLSAGLPAGVFNVVHGRGSIAGSALVAHDKVSAISFTGGTDTGSVVAGAASSKFKKLSLELGGKNPNIIFADCDLEAAVKSAVESSFRNSGQVCLCASRILVESSIKDKFEKLFIEQVKLIKVGNPKDPLVSMGSVISTDHLKKIESYVELAKEEGGKILCGGKRPYLSDPFNSGSFYEPTVIGSLDHNSRTVQEEIFGPVVTIHDFKNYEEALSLANGVKYGLAATIWTSNIERAHLMANEIEAGIVWVNSWLVRDLRTPFGGMKASGIGREGGQYSLDFFSECKNIYINLPKRFRSPLNQAQPNYFKGKAIENQDRKEVLNVSHAPKPVGAYPHARRHGDFLFLSGIGPRQAKDNSIPGGPITNASYDIRAQTEAVIQNVRTILEASGSCMDKIVDVQVFLVDMDRDFTGFNEVYKRHFEGLNATRTTCAIRALPTPIAVEFKVIATSD